MSCDVASLFTESTKIMVPFIIHFGRVSHQPALQMITGCFTHPDIVARMPSDRCLFGRVVDTNRGIKIDGIGVLEKGLENEMFELGVRWGYFLTDLKIGGGGKDKSYRIKLQNKEGSAHLICVDYCLRLAATILGKLLVWDYQKNSFSSFIRELGLS